MLFIYLFSLLIFIIKYDEFDRKICCHKKHWVEEKNDVFLYKNIMKECNNKFIRLLFKR